MKKYLKNLIVLKVWGYYSWQNIRYAVLVQCCGWIKSTCWRTVLMLLFLLLCHFCITLCSFIYFLCHALRPRFSFDITCITVEMLAIKSRDIQSASHGCFFTFFSKFVVHSNMGIAWCLVEGLVCEVSNTHLRKCSSAPGRFVFLFINIPKVLLY